MAPTRAKSTVAMAPTKKSSSTKKPSSMTYEDMIIEAIASYGDEGRSGLGRPTLKKVILAKHPSTGKLPLASFTTHLNSAIVRGKDKGVFLLPKGVSGKVKLAAKAKHAAAMSTAPKKTTTVLKAAPKSSSSKKTKSSTSKAASAKKTTTAKAPTKKTATTRKSPAKTTTRKTPAKKASAKTATTRKTPTKKAPSKKTATTKRTAKKSSASKK